ncbi:MAG: hypothetical protein LBD36_00455 [Holosporales bacterium]|nr:hypothetical protein [Holosporales bacterium]
MFIIAIEIIIAVIAVLACVFIYRERGVNRVDTIVNLLQQSCIPWCVVSLEEKIWRQPKLLCSDEFSKIFGEKFVFIEDIVNALENAGNSQIQEGIQRALQTVEQVITNINYKENTYEVSISAIKVSSQNKTSISENMLNGGVLLIFKNITEETKRKRTYSSAIEQINDLLNVLNALPVPVWTRQFDGTISFCNIAYAKLLETQQYQVISQQLELIDGSHSTVTKNLYKNVLSMKKLQTIDVQKNCKGNTKIFRMYENLVTTDDQTASKYTSVGLAIDISERTQEYQCIKDKLQLYQSILNVVDSHFCVVSKDSRIVAYSHTFESMLGINLSNKDTHVDEVLEQLREQEKLPGDIDFWQLKDLCTQWISHKNIPFNKMWHMPLGAVLNIFVEKCSENNIIISIKDITHVLNMESRYKSLYAMWNVVVDQSKDAILIIEKNHKIQMCSACTESMLCTNVQTGSSIKEFLTTFAQKYSLYIWQTNLENTIELRNPYSTVVAVAKNVLLCEYLPLPSGWHMLRFSLCPNQSESRINTLFDEIQQKNEKCLKVS